MIRVADSPVIPFQGTYDPEKEAPFAVLERAATRYIEDSDTGCWNSTYSRMSAGYSQVGWQRASGKPVTRTPISARTRKVGGSVALV